MTREEARQWLREVVQRDLAALRTDVALTMTAARVINGALDDAERVEWMEQQTKTHEVIMWAQGATHVCSVQSVTSGWTAQKPESLRAAIDAARGK